MSKRPRFPRTVLLLGHRTAKVLRVHYALGRDYYRIEYAGEDKPTGCIAKWATDELFEERTLADMRAEVSLPWRASMEHTQTEETA